MKKIIIVVAALLGAFIWTGCQREELIDDSFNPEEIGRASCRERV